MQAESEKTVLYKQKDIVSSVTKHENNYKFVVSSKPMRAIQVKKISEPPRTKYTKTEKSCWSSCQKNPATLYFDGCVTVSTTEKILSCIGRTTFEGERSVCVNLLLTQKSEGKPLARLVLPTVLLLAHLPLGKYVPRLSGPQMFTFTLAHGHQTRVEGISSMIANLPSSFLCP